VSTTKRLARYCWAAPYSLLGLLLGAVAVLAGGSMRRAAGCLEFGGGRLGQLLRRLPPQLSFSAITFGHVILGVDHTTLSALRSHEHVHVRQYERWGPLYIPAYLASSLVELLRGRSPYRDNYFERQAFAQADMRARASKSA
jgi:hypothetical protein